MTEIERLARAMCAEAGLGWDIGTPESVGLTEEMFALRRGILTSRQEMFRRRAAEAIATGVKQ